MNGNTRYDVITLTTDRTLVESDSEVIFAKGEIAITLHDATTPGIIKKIYNIGDKIVTIIGTVNGDTNNILYPHQSVELITDGLGWRC
jgi:hypothetical protein